MNFSLYEQDKIYEIEKSKKHFLLMNKIRHMKSEKHK